MKGKNGFACILILLAGLVVGGLIGQLASGVSALSWLNFGQSFGVQNPFVLDLGILVLTFGLTIRISIASVIGIILGVIVYRRL